MDKFIARYEDKGIRKSVVFDKLKFNQEKAEAWLKQNNIQNFFFFFEPNEPEPFGENGIRFTGDVGFDIALNNLLPEIQSGKEIILDTYGGDLYEGLKIYDAIKELNLNPSIGILGTCASSGMQILLATENRWMTPNSRGLIHNPWTMVAGDDEVLRTTAKELEFEKLNLAKIYSNTSGKSLDEILSLMKEERFLNSDEMLAMNFVKAKNAKIEDVELIINNKNEMKEEEKEKLGVIENVLNKISAKLFPPKNIIVQDVNGVEIDFGDAVETAEQIAIGATATIDGNPANGEYVISDGTTYVFENGSLMEITEPTEELDAEALQAENERLNQELELLKAENSKVKEDFENSIKSNEEVKADLEKIKEDFENFKNKFSDEQPEINTPVVEEEKQKRVSFNVKFKN